MWQYQYDDAYVEREPDFEKINSWELDFEEEEALSRAMKKER